MLFLSIEKAQMSKPLENMIARTNNNIYIEERIQLVELFQIDWTIFDIIVNITYASRN